MRRITLATVALVGALSLPALGQSMGVPVPMTDHGLRQWVATMPTDTAVANDLFGVIKECDCPPGVERQKAVTVYMDGLFHHHGYSYGATVREYYDAMTGTGDYRYERTNLIPASGIEGLLLPAIELIQHGHGEWLVDNWLMLPGDLAAVEKVLAREQ